MAVLTLVWAALTAGAVLPTSPSGHTPAAQADAAATARPALSSLILGDAPLAYWRLQDSSPAVVRDEVGGHHGTGHGALEAGQVAQGPSMTSMHFDGRTARITAPAAGLAPGTVAVSAWVRTRQQPGAGFGGVVDTGGLSLMVAGGRAVGVSCGLADGCRAVWSAAPVTDGAWHQLALSVVAGVATLYVDGQRSTTGSAPGVDAPAAGGQVTIGRVFNGNIDNVALFAHPLAAAEIATEFGAGACPQAAGTVDPPATAAAPLPALPLHTSGRWIVDAHGARVKLAGVNWYGAEELDGVPGGLQCQSADAIAAHIAAEGFNVVRLPWATDAWVGPPRRVPPVAVAANPALRGLDARAAFDAVIAALGRHGLMVVLDNHVSRPDWCCAGNDGNALWWTSYDPAHPPRWSNRTWRGKLRLYRWGEARWVNAWRVITARYAPGGAHPQPNVVAADLRNELRMDTTLRLDPAWKNGRVPPWLDWPRAAQRAGDAVLRRNPRLLVTVEGLHYATDLRGARVRPVRLAVPHRLVYSAHDYGWFHPSADGLRAELDARWGRLLRGTRPTPVWLGEFGTCHPEDAQCGDGAWFAALRTYISDRHLDWAYWSVGGTGARGAADPTTCSSTPRSPGCVESFGLTDPTWGADASNTLSAQVRALAAP